MKASSRPWWSRIDRRAMFVGTVAGTVLVVSGLALISLNYHSCPVTSYGPFVPCEHYLFGIIPMTSTGGAFFLIGMIILVASWLLYLRRNKQAML